MPPSAAWAGFAIAAVSLVFNLYQWHAHRMAKGVIDHHRDQLFGIKTSLIQLRVALQEASERLSIFKSEDARVWIGTVGHKDKMIEHHVDIMLGLLRLPMKELNWFKRLWRVLFPLAVRDQPDKAVWESEAGKLAEEAKQTPGPAAPEKTGTNGEGTG